MITPGPWKISTETNTGIVSDDGLIVGHACGYTGSYCFPSDDDAPDNARLMAAAPQLLEALEEISLGAGPFSRDPLTHADNCIEAMKKVAIDAITLVKGDHHDS